MCILNDNVHVQISAQQEHAAAPLVRVDTAVCKDKIIVSGTGGFLLLTKLGLFLVRRHDCILSLASRIMSCLLSHCLLRSSCRVQALLA
jgi:hypothetical protein